MLLYVLRTIRSITSTFTQLLSPEMEVGEVGRLYTYRYTVTTRMTPALRRAVLRAILMFHYGIMKDKVTRQCPQNHNLSEEKGEPKRNRTEALLSAYQPNALPLGQTGSQMRQSLISQINLQHPTGS